MKMPGNMQQMMKQAQQMQERLQEEIAQIRVEASAGGGMVTVKMDGQKSVLSVSIEEEVAGDVEMLQDMMVAAFNEAAKKVDDVAKLLVAAKTDAATKKANAQKAAAVAVDLAKKAQAAKATLAKDDLGALPR